MEIKNLNEVCMINMGQSPDSSSYNDKKEGLAFYQGNADFGEIHPTTRVWCNNPIKIAEKDDILISVRAPIGSMNIANEKCCIGRGLASIKPIDKNECNQNYLYYFLESKVPYMQSKGTGSTFKAINKGILTSLQIKLPNIREQEKISSIISKIKAQIHNKKLQIRKYDELVKSQFIEMFGDLKNNSKNFELATIKDYFRVGSSKRVFEKDWTKSGVPFYRAREVVKLSENGFVDNELFISEKMYQEYSMKYGKPCADDIIVTAVGTLGKTYIVKPNDKFYYKDGNIILLHKINDISSIYVNYLYQTDFIKDQIIKTANVITVGTYTIKNAQNTQIIVPPIELQNQFADFVKLIDKLKFSETITKLKNLCYNVFNVIQSKNLGEVKNDKL